MKKYSNPEAFKLYENFLVSREAQSKWFDNLDLEDERFKEILDSEFIVPLKERDENGCRVILCQSAKFDTKKFNEHDVYRVIIWVVLNVLEEPDTQVAGVAFITDFKNAGLEYVSQFSFNEMRSIIHCLQNTVPVRFKKAIWINFPPFAVALAEMGKSFTSKKVADRVSFHTDEKEVTKVFDKKIMPKEFGGEIPIKEMVESFMTFARNQKDKLKLIEAMSIDLSRVNDYKADPVDSFKKLEID